MTESMKTTSMACNPASAIPITGFGKPLLFRDAISLQSLAMAIESNFCLEGDGSLPSTKDPGGSRPEVCRAPVGLRRGHGSRPWGIPVEGTGRIRDVIAAR